MIKTEFFNDFVDYYRKAKILQDGNCVNVKNHVNDPIMDNVTIYDTVNRRHAGFSKILEDIHGVRIRKDLQRLQDCTQMFSSKEFHFFHLLHRFSGSGASFQPTFLQDGSRNPKEHGYHNSLIPKLIPVMAMDSIEGVRDAIVRNTDPMVTSVGNQPPSLKNADPSKYRLAQQYYFDQVADSFVTDYLTFLMNNEYKTNKPTGIKEAVDFSCAWHKERGFKQWHFVMTAFVMDTAEYYPELVDPTSHCYYGANCVRSFDLIFQKEKGDPKSKADFQELCMTELCKAVNGNPYDVEDVCCDYIRYCKEYIPKGYDHLTQEQRVNNSILKVNGEYPPEILARINQVLG